MHCLCACSCVPLVLHACVGSDEKDDDCSVELSVYIINRVHCVLCSVHTLLTLLFLYCVLKAEVMCVTLTDTLLHYT